MEIIKSREYVVKGGEKPSQRSRSIKSVGSQVLQDQFSSQVIAVILAVFLHHGNGRAITSTNNDNIGRMLDLAEEELNMVLNETNENPTEREENPADVLRSSGPDSSSHEALQSQFSSDNMIQPKEASPVLRQKRSHTGPCYTASTRRSSWPAVDSRHSPFAGKLRLPVVLVQYQATSRVRGYVWRRRRRFSSAALMAPISWAYLLKAAHALREPTHHDCNIILHQEHTDI